MIPSTFQSLTGFWKTKNVNIYDTVFKLHSKFTVCILVGCTLVLAVKHYVGVKIDCIETSGKFKSQMDHFCWMTGTYISQHHFNGTIGVHLAHYGVAPRYVPVSQRDYQKYYQWVSIFLMIHALIIYLPAFCWKTWEKRTMQRLIGGLSDDFFVTKENETKINYIYNFFLHDEYRVRHRIYATHYLLAEILNLAAVVGNILLLNFFLNGFWLQFWPAVEMLFAFDYNSWLSTSARTFPRLAKCEFWYVGVSGTLTNIDSLCLLPLNVFNEKIYAALYIWFLVLFVISALNVAWKLLMLLCRPLRMLWIRFEYREVPAYQWEAALDGGSYGQWFLFQRIAKNLSANIVQSLAQRLCHTAREEYYLK